ncbi:MAG: DUF2785 domain-containing protein [Xanthomonadales bacterium]|nr:DUF2785 domain-containing protein [Xanthomonadales bacterium]
MREIAAVWMAAAAMLVVAIDARAACPPAGTTRAGMNALADTGFALDDARERNRLALELVDCLGHPDPQWRDRIAYEALAGWIRADQLDSSTLLDLAGRLSATLASSAPDKAGFRKSFSALVLAALVEADRRRPFLQDGATGQLVDAASDWFESIRDYRGFDARAGWRHAIAHGSDLLAQLALDPRATRADIDRIVGALETQIAPAGSHFYIHGEPERIALPLLYIAGRDFYTTEQWQDWFAGIAAVPEDGNLFGSQAALARRHNLQAVLLVLYVNANESKDDGLHEVLLPAVTASLRRLQ